MRNVTKPNVSVVVPVYNTEKYLERCLDSLRKQTLQNIEIILVDDGSKEPCAALCDALAKTDPRIRVVHKKNGGLGFARNTGMEAAAGEYIGFVDSDDYIEPTMYEALYDAAKRNDADLAISGICFVGGNMFSESGGDISKSYFAEETHFAKEDMKKLLLGVVGALPNEPDDSRYGVSVCKNIFKLSVIREKGLAFLSEREVLSEDTLFMVDFIKSAEAAVGVPGAYYGYCRNEASLSKAYKKDRFEKSLVFLGVLEQRIADAVSEAEYRIYLDRLTQGFGRILCSQEIVHARKEHIAFTCLRKRLKEICTADRIQNALKTYPWHRLPVKQAAFAFAMKYKLFLLQIIMVILRDG